MQPVDWDNSTRDNKFDQINPTVFGLFQLDGQTVPGSEEGRYHKVFPLLQFTVNLHLPEEADDPVDLAPGRWYHVAMTWDGADITYYVNGARRDSGGAFWAQLELRTAGDPYPYKNSQARWWTESKPVTLRFQENLYWEQTKLAMPRTVIDDFRIYRRPLAPSEIANLAALPDPRVEPKALPAADMAMTYNGVAGRVTARLTPLLPDFAKVASAAVSVTKRGATAPVGQQAEAAKGTNGIAVTVQCPPLEFADYEVKAELKDAGGAVLGTLRQAVTRVAPPWWGCKAGVTDKVMPDWTPMTADGAVIRMWGRAIHLAPSGLPAKVISQGEDVLAGPVTLEITAGGKPLALKPAGEAVTVTAATAVRVDARGGLTGEALAVAVASYAEFDGMMWFTVTLTPMAGQTPTIDRLTLTVPYAAANAELIHWWSGNQDFRNPKAVWIGALPPGPGEVFQSTDKERVALLAEQRGSFIPYVMLTGMTRGMAWFGENDRGWTQSVETPAVAVVRDGNTVKLVLNVISSSVKLEAPRTFEFGLHPIPVKPLDPLWRQFPTYSNVFPDTFCGNNLKGRRGASSFNTCIEDDWAAVKRRIDGDGLTKGAAGLKGLYQGQLERLKKEGITDPPPQTLTVPGLYWDMQWTGNMPAHSREWAEVWFPNYQSYTPEFVDFASWCWDEWIAKTDKFVRGAYVDDCWGAPQTVKEGLRTYQLPDGQVQPGYQFRAWRERFKRMRQISWDHGVQPHLTAHTTHTFFVPYHSFFDLILDGEDFYSEPSSQADFIDHWRPDYLRFMHNAKWGLVTTWLGWCGNSLKTDKWPTWSFRQQRAYEAMLNLHEIIHSLVPRALDTVALPYWNDGGLARHEHPGLLVGGWRYRNTCRVLLVNTGKARIEATVRLDVKVMGLAAPKVKDIDTTLLTYFDDDVTQLKAPDKPKDGVELENKELGDDLPDLEEKPRDLPLAERRARDPDGKFKWESGVLKCPVRPHDYRLFEFVDP